MVGTSGLIEKIPATDEWTYVVLISCIGVFITMPIFIYIMICVARKTQASKWILLTAFGYLISLFLYSLSQFVIFKPSRWNIEPSQYICSYVKRPEIIFMGLARFCFYQFNVIRIKIIFGQTPKLSLPQWQFIFMQILIFGYFCYHAIVFNALTTMKPHPQFGFCFATQEHSDIHVGIFILWDAVIVFILICMFSGKLIYGVAAPDVTLKRYAIKTSVLGILSTFSALMVTLLFFLGRMNRFVFVTDGLLNSICIVMSFNLGYVTLPKCKRSAKEKKKESNDLDYDEGKLENEGRTYTKVTSFDTELTEAVTDVNV
eukprot:360134_1